MRPLRNLSRCVVIMLDILSKPKASLQSVMTFGLLHGKIFFSKGACDIVEGFYHFNSRILGLCAIEKNWQTLRTKQLNQNIV